jgi:hypothetical protein
MASTAIRIAVEIFVLLVLAPGVVYTGWRRYRTGTVPPDSVEFYRLVVYANICNALLSRPPVRTLTVRRIKWAGLCYMAVGLIVWLGTVLILVIGEC